MLKEKLIKAIILSDDAEIIEKVEQIISDTYPFKHELKDILQACSISSPDFTKIDVSSNPSRIIESIEKNYSKRQISYMFTMLMADSVEKKSSKNETEKTSKELMDELKNQPFSLKRGMEVIDALKREDAPEDLIEALNALLKLRARLPV